jgi:predicted transcriptional regulator
MTLDEIDRELLAEIVRHPGSAVIDIIRPLLKRKSNTALRYRLQSLELQSIIRTEKRRDRVLVFPSNSKNRGHEAHDLITKSEAP